MTRAGETETAGGTAVESSTPTVRAHGMTMPALGLGTWNLTGSDARRMTEVALGLGYRHIDTAQAYENEAEIGRALEEASVPRDDVFVTTKVWPDRYRPADFRGGVERSLERLRTDYVDLLLLHWPRFEGTSLGATVEELNRARADGRARHVGISNFTTDLVDRAWELSAAPLPANQVEYHPFLSQDAVLRKVRARKMILTAYCPLAQGRVVGNDVLQEIGARYGKSEAQVALRWLVQQDGVAAVPRTSDREHCRENLQVFDFELAGDEMERIASLAEPGGRIIDPAGLAPAWD